MQRERMKTAFLMTHDMRCRCFSDKDLARLAELSDVVDRELAELDEDRMVQLASGADAILTCWGTPPLTPKVLQAAPELGIFCHCAGTVKPYVHEDAWPVIWDRDIVVTNTAAALGVGVAEFALGMIITSLKKVFFMRDAVSDGAWHEVRGIASDPYDVTIGVIGAGSCGGHVIKLLQNFDLRVLLYDPYKSEEDCARLGAEKVELDYLMANSDCITLHAPNIPQNEGMISRELIKRIKDGAVFINTARGMEVDEPALIDELKTGRFYACLDVTEPEPPAKDNPLRRMKNVFLTPHIAGHASNGMKRQGRYAVDELRRFSRGEPVLYRVTRDRLDITA